MRSRTASIPHATLFQALRSALALTGLAIGVWLAVAGAAQAQSVAKPGTEAAPQAVPGFWDPRRRPDRPDLSRLTVIRFLTETDYPPFNLNRKPEEAAADLKHYL